MTIVKLESAKKLKYVEKPLLRIDAFEKVLGMTKFGMDLYAPNMIFGAVKRSPLPHALIKKIDASAAERLSGVRAVVTAKHVPGGLYGVYLKDTPALAVDRVRYVGEPVAAVAADSREIAQQAAELIDVDYAELPVVVDPEKAMMAEQNTNLHPRLSQYEVAASTPQPRADLPNVGNYWASWRGDIKAGFSQSDLIVENRFSMPKVQHSHTEPIACLASADRDSVSVWTSTQSPYRVRAMLSDVLGIDRGKIRVVGTQVGGGFGNRLTIHGEAIAALLAIRSRRPVKVEFSREETFTASNVMHGYVIYVKDGVKANGKIVAREIRVILDGGAYGTAGLFLGLASIYPAGAAYDVPNFRIETYRVYTNTVPAGPFRSMGCQPIFWALESQIDLIAKKLKLDPIEVRKINLVSSGQPNCLGEIVPHVAYGPVLEKAREVQSRINPRSQDTAWRRAVGIGLGSKYSAEPAASASVRYKEDGTVEVWVTASEIGQGSQTGLAQIVAEELKIPPSRIRVMEGDTALTPFDTGAQSNRLIFNLGNALIRAIADLKKEILRAASEKLGVDTSRLWWDKGRVMTDDGSCSVEVQELFQRGKTRYGAFLDRGSDFWGHASWVLPVGHLDPKTGQASQHRIHAAYSAVAHVAEVAVNIETGHVIVERLTSIQDVGRAINPQLVQGQIEGAGSMGLSIALFEEMVLQNGRVLNPDYKDYRLMMSFDTVPIESILVTQPHPDGPYGAKPVGEVAIVGVAPAIANAIHNAVGVRIRDLPMTAERVLRQIQEARSQ